MSDDQGTSSHPGSRGSPPPTPIGTEPPPTVVGPVEAGGPTSSPSDAEVPAPAPRRSRSLQVVGVLLIVLGAFFSLAAVVQFGRTPQDGPVIVALVLAVGTFAGGVHFVRHGWWSGHDVRNVLAVLPPAVLISIIVLGMVAGGGTPPPGDDLSRVFEAASDYRLSAADVWADYADPEISARRWVRTVDESMPSLEAALRTLNAEVAQIQNEDERADWEALAQLLDDELGVIVDLRGAVARLDVGAERTAQRRLLEVQRETAELIRRLVSESGGQPS
jgi:hypothetical protein